MHRLRQQLQQQKSEDDQQKPPNDEPEEETHPSDPFEHELSFLAYLCELETPINNSLKNNMRGGFPGPASQGWSKHHH
jgi:hypothetical protein